MRLSTRFILLLQTLGWKMGEKCQFSRQKRLVEALSPCSCAAIWLRARRFGNTQKFPSFQSSCADAKAGVSR
ncbi:hypothetical protein CKO11_07185 [Rhodobacter sp. TJ_12]|nr:hypothetical protein [Rhodobacter sp. TJ_12]